MMELELTEEELKIESLEVEDSNIRLESNATKCQVCKVGDVVTVGRETNLIVYTRSGTKKCVHVEKRCNNRSLPCRAGHYYGYVKCGSTKLIDSDALRKQFIVTSNQTAFSIDYMWDITLQILFSRATYEGLGNVYNNFHFTNLPYDTLQKREVVIAKRIAEAFYAYAFIELGQRYNIEMVIPKTLDDVILEKKSEMQDFFRTYWTKNHDPKTCNTPGCGCVITFDGGLKPHRKLCASKLSGVREFLSTGLKVVTGCTSIPASEAKFCSDHKNCESPALLSDKVTKTTRMKLRDHTSSNATSKEAPQDNIYVIESILETKKESGVTFFKVKWLNFPSSEATWEPSDSIPKFVQLYYKDGDKFGKCLPNPNLKRVKRAGSAVYHLLSWEGDSTASQWLHEDFFKLLGEDGEIVSSLDDNGDSCNTRKSRDKRTRRHTVGILVGAFPCGIITVYDELYGSESITQVYAIMIEYLASLPKETRENIVELCYDDACHFKKFSENEKRANVNEITKFMAGLGKHVDKFHFPNHVDDWCHKNCNPQDVKHLDGVNTPICEQLFSAINKYTNAKAMNEAHFFLFFLYVFDLHNLNIEGMLRSVANPHSEYRYEIIKKHNDNTAQNNVQNIGDVITLLGNMDFNDIVPSDNHDILQNEDDGDIGNQESIEVIAIIDSLNKCQDDAVNTPENHELLVTESVNKSNSPESVNKSNSSSDPNLFFPCQFCGAKYKRLGNLTLHINKKHIVQTEVSIPNQCACKTCGKLFECDTDLEKHVKLHLKCTICDIPFEELKYLNRHNKIHHSVIVCSVCGIECKDKEAHDLHQSVHLKCEKCDKEFDKKHKLTRHLKTHK